MHTLPSGRVRFGAFELDIATGELRLADTPGPDNKVLLREQVFQVLRMLIERGGKIVTREEIKNRLWPNDTVVDFDHSINATIKTLRRALGDSADNPRYIETLARRGYRLLVTTKWLESTAASPRGHPTSLPAQPEPSSLIGKKVSHYRVLDVIGGGGMGMVYRAEDLKLGRSVALKFLPEELTSDAVALQRFEREARTASSLNHPNICTVHAIEEHEGKPFIVMELLEGETLRTRLAAIEPKALPFHELTEIAMQVCGGLEAAHQKGIIHRDIKPANIFRCKLGVVKILDFGLAKLASGTGIEKAEAATPPAASSADILKNDLTRTGTTAGTAGYMSPEQVRHEELDTRTDLFSLGLVLYEMAAGQRAFTGETVVDLHEAILHETPIPPRVRNPMLPRGFDALMAKTLEKDREKRYQSATALKSGLECLVRAANPMKRRALQALIAAVSLALIAVGISRYEGYRHRITLAPTDTIVLADVDNQTSDPVFDDALYTALRFGMEQTPYLNILGVDKVFGTLAQLNLPLTTKLTPEVARKVCVRTNSKFVVVDTIADAGVHYTLELQAIECQSGKPVAQVSEEVANRNEIVHMLGIAAVQLRHKLGEPSASLARFNKPLEEALSSSLEALQAGTLGYKRHITGDVKGAIPYYQRSLELDPNLASTYEALGSAYYFLFERDFAIAAFTRAYELRTRMTEPSRLETEFLYYANVTGESEKALSALLQSVQTFPRNVYARVNLSTYLGYLGQPDRAADEAREAARLQPTAVNYVQWVINSIRAGRLNEAQASLSEAPARNSDSLDIHYRRVLLAFLQDDQRAMQEQWNQGIGRQDAYEFLLWRSNVEEYHGRFRKARELVQQASNMAPSAVDVLKKDGYVTALWEAESGDTARAKQIAATVLRTVSSRDDKLNLALALARAGSNDQARKMADALDKDSPLDTLVQNYHLPTIRAAMKLNENDPAAAIAALQPSLKYELSWNYSFNGLYPAYIRGLAYLQLGEGRLAAAEFQKLQDHRGLVGTDVIGALAHLQMARAQKMMGDEASARKAYEDFLTLWKDADSDIPIYQQAKAEYAKLRKEPQRLN
jgi:eukaryotic-like serine/threonine-protein kinase